MLHLLKNTKIAHRLMLLTLMTVIGFVAINAVMLLQSKASMLEQKQVKTRHLVESAYSLLEYYAGLAREGALSEHDAQQAAANAVRNLRYEEKEYFWINDMHPRMVMHPYKPQLEGKDLSGVKDPGGKLVFQEFVNTVKADGAGFVNYMWPKPGFDEAVAKISYVKGFAPWQWVIGSGIYIDDIDVMFHAAVKRQAFICVVVLGVICLLSLVVSKGITRPLQRAVALADAVADGHLENPVDIDSTDETGQVLRALVKMQSKLRDTIAHDKRVAAETNRLKQALDNVVANVMVADQDHNIIYLNATVKSMFRAAQADIRNDMPGFDIDKLMGRSIDDFHQNPHHQHSLLATLTSAHHAEFTIGGHTFRFVANPIVDAAGQRLGTVVEWDDVTDERAVEHEVQSIVESVVAGDLSQRIPMEGKQGIFGVLSKGINNLVDVSDQVITDTSRMLGAMANGDLSGTIENDFQGAFAQLKLNANATLEKLTEVISEIKTGAGEISTGAEEISQGNANLSQRTEQQAASLEETSSSMEQMTSTVKQNADNAAQANQLASSARGQAEQGGAVVNQAIAAMAEINDSSKKIADIIGVIDEIAFQTNLLALNAAVEAARAGEQGRGFAVVANEVRNLAQRSAEAAKEIKTLIEDSVGKVDGGSRLVNDSGHTLDEIVTSVKKVSDIIAEIAAASEEQSAGIELVNKAVLQMDQMTQQNAALVEQAAAASESMSDQARGMNNQMAFFQVGETIQPAPSASQRVERRSAARPWSGSGVNTGSQPVPQSKAAGGSDAEWDEF